jgi:hypothetical protein
MSAIASLLDRVPTKLVSIGLKVNAVFDLIMFLGVLPAHVMNEVAPITPGLLTPAGVDAYHNGFRWTILLHGVVRYAAGQHVHAASHRQLAFASYALEALQFFFAARTGVITSCIAPMPLLFGFMFLLYFKNFEAKKHDKK